MRKLIRVVAVCTCCEVTLLTKKPISTFSNQSLILNALHKDKTKICIWIYRRKNLLFTIVLPKFDTWRRAESLYKRACATDACSYQPVRMRKWIRSRTFCKAHQHTEKRETDMLRLDRGHSQARMDMRSVAFSSGRFFSTSWSYNLTKSRGKKISRKLNYLPCIWRLYISNHVS